MVQQFTCKYEFGQCPKYDYFIRHFPEPRKRHLQLSKPLSLDAFCAQMAPPYLYTPNEPSHIFTCPDVSLPKPLRVSMRLWPPLSAFECLWVSLDGDPTRTPLSLKRTDLMTLLVPFRRFRVMCSTRSKQFRCARAEH